MVLKSVKSIKGKREYMEDRYAYIEKDDIIVSMVCDGHGGHEVADKTCKQLPELILQKLEETRGTNVNHALAIRRVVRDWGRGLDLEHSGSTLTGIAIKNDIVYIYNIGDSRTCIKLKPGTFVYRLDPIFNNSGQFVERLNIDYERTSFYCTTDHDTDCSLEHSRVVNSGGYVSDSRLNGILSVTRALGDGDIGAGISFIPDVTWVKKTEMTGPIVMYSDGIYEMQRYDAPADFSDKYLYAIADNFGAKALVDYAYTNGSDDNLTAMVVDY